MHKYVNLSAEMTRKEILKKDIYEFLQISPRTLTRKFTHVHFTIEEAFLIRNKFFPEYTLEYLFQYIKK